jgi:hypothetical protein
VLAALEDMEFSEFIEPLRKNIDGYKKAQSEKKSRKASEKKEREQLEASQTDVGGGMDTSSEPHGMAQAVGGGGMVAQPVAAVGAEGGAAAASVAAVASEAAPMDTTTAGAGSVAVSTVPVDIPQVAAAPVATVAATATATSGATFAMPAP